MNNKLASVLLAASTTITAMAPSMAQAEIYLGRECRRKKLRIMAFKSSRVRFARTPR